MLTREQRGRHHDRDLLAAHGRDKGGAQRDFGLAEADIAANQTIHRPAGAEVFERSVDRGLLIFGLLIGETRAEFVIHAGRDNELLRFAQFAFGRNLHQLMGDFADAVLHPRFARLPSAAAEPIKFDFEVFGAVARQQVDILDRQIELGVAGIMQFEAVMRCAGCFDRLQADEAPDAVIDMHHKIASREARGFRDEILGALATPAADAPAGRREYPARR